MNKLHRRSNIPTKALCGRTYWTEKDEALTDNPYAITCAKCWQIAWGYPIDARQPGKRHYTPQQRLNNLYRDVLERKPSVNGGNIILVNLVTDPFTPYVTWSEDQNGNTFSGHYFESYDEALKDYHKRA